MSEGLKSVHVRLTSECHSAVNALALASNTDIVQICEQVIEEGVLGRIHLLKVAAERMHRSGIIGKERESP